jgi:hypothetical protein
MILRMTLLGLALAIATPAQWLHIPLPGTPRTKDGRPNLKAPPPRFKDGKLDFGGIWVASRRFTNPSAAGIARYMPPGSTVPLLPHAQRAFAELTAFGDAPDPSERCLPDGIPGHMLALPLKILQTPAVTVMLFEEFDVFRQIFTDGRKLPADPFPSWFGYAVARWEKDSFVVESSGYTTQTYLDGQGLPHSEDLRITERYRRPDFGHLSVEFTFDDPKNYSQPWTATVPFDLMPDTELIDHICENERDLKHLYRGPAQP